jgi:uncharacterized phage-associated protein
MMAWFRTLRMAAKATALDVARLFLAWANRDGDVITNLKMQKLLYYAQAWHLVNFGQPLFDDQIQAWNFGPVVRSIYHEFKAFGSSPIDYKKTGQEEKQFSPEQLTFLREFYSTFIRFSAHELVSMTHAEDPWINANRHGASSAIDPAVMKAFYEDFYQKNSR